MSLSLVRVAQTTISLKPDHPMLSRLHPVSFLLELLVVDNHRAFAPMQSLESRLILQSRLRGSVSRDSLVAMTPSLKQESAHQHASEHAPNQRKPAREKGEGAVVRREHHEPPKRQIECRW